MSSITERFSSPNINAVDFSAQMPILYTKDNSPTTPSASFDDRSFDVVRPVKKLIKRFKTTQKFIARADFFTKSDTKLDALKMISLATFPFIMFELYQKVKRVFEVTFNVSIKDHLPEKTADLGAIALGIGKRIYDTAFYIVKIVESSMKTKIDASIVSLTKINLPSSFAKIDLSKTLSIAIAPFILFDMCKKITKIYKVVIDQSMHLKNKLERMTDFGLSIIDNCVDITKIIANLIANNTLATVTGFLSAITIVIEAKKFRDSIMFYRRISQENFSLADQSKYDVKKNLDPSDKVQCILKMNGRKEKEILLQEIKNRISDHSKDPSVFKDEEIDKISQKIFKKISSEKQHIVESVKNATKARSIQTTIYHALKGLASAINIAATAILLAVPPLAPVSFGLLGLSSLLSLSAFISDHYFAQKWENAMTRVVKNMIDQERKIHLNTSMKLLKA